MHLLRTAFLTAGMLLAAGLPPAIARAAQAEGYPLSDHQRALLNVFLADEADSFVRGGKTLIGLSLSAHVTATKVAAAYDENEIAGDKQYKGRQLFVTGRIAGIQTDIAGDPVVTLDGATAFSNAAATFDGDVNDRAAALKKGQPIQLICTGAGKALATIVFSHCAFADAYASRTVAELKQHLGQLFADQAKFSPGSTEEVLALGLVAVASSLSPTEWACVTSLNQAIATTTPTLHGASHSIFQTPCGNQIQKAMKAHMDITSLKAARDELTSHGVAIQMEMPPAKPPARVATSAGTSP